MESDERIRELEDRLAEAERQRDALEKDVEALCMQNGEFSGSDVLANRISQLEQWCDIASHQSHHIDVRNGKR